MSNELAQRVEELLARALMAPDAERAAVLAARRGPDPEVVRRVELLLAESSPDAETRLERPRPAALDTGAATMPAGELADVFPGYQVVRRLSQGGQGVVYQAVETATKRKVALKVLLEGVHASKATRRRFEREIEIVAQFRHPNIIGVLHAAQATDGRQFYVMDYVRGEPLTAYVRSKSLSLDAALELFATLCDAVQYAHQRGIIHRDLKPSNVLVDTEGRLRVLDFGLAKSLGTADNTLISMTGQAVGTLAYMSPEQTRGNPEEIDTRTDVYALGVMLYEVLCGRFPYPVTGSIADVFRHISSTPPTSPSRHWSADSGIASRTAARRAGRCPIDAELETIVFKALAKERERRYPSAGELARDIRHYLAGEAIEARRDSALYVLRKTLGRYRAAAGVVAGIVLLLAAFSVVMTIQAGRIAHERDKALAAEQEQARLRALAESEQRKAQTEADVAKFRQLQARREVHAATMERAERGIALRQSHDQAQFAPVEARADYPSRLFADGAQWLKRQLPEWFTDINNASPSGVQLLPASIRDIEATVAIAPSDPRHQPLYDWVAANEATIERIVAETGRRQFDFGGPVILDRSTTFWMTLFLPAMNTGRELCKLLSAHAARQHVAGLDAKAVESLAAARRSTRLISRSNTLISLLVECGIRVRLYMCVATFAIDAAERGDDPAPYVRYMTTDAPLMPMGPFLQAELVSLRQGIVEAFAPPEPGARPRLQEQPLRALLATLVEEKDRDERVAKLLAQAGAIELEDALGILQVVGDVFASVDQFAPGELDRHDGELSQKVKKNPLVDAFVSAEAYRRAIVLVQKTRAQRDGTIVAVALATFRHKQGRWPASIDDALEACPLRPVEKGYFGQPLVYRLHEGSPLLYSVGENRIDDGGSPDDDLYVLPPEFRERAIERSLKRASASAPAGP